MRKFWKEYDSEMDSTLRMESISSNAGGGLYIHVPFCRRKCVYCDFYSVGERCADWSRYVDAVAAELRFRINELPSPLRTIYIGGGTPSLMPTGEFLRLCDVLALYSGQVEEFTIEVNPDDVDTEKLEAWKRGGVNRVSMGIQSFNDEVLRKVGRRHTAGDAGRAYEMLCCYFKNVSIDLIYGIPGQTPEMWRNDVRRAVAMRPAHVSSYSLMYEPGTALTVMRDRGDLQETSDEVSEKMYEVLVETLKAAGYDHYEISNFALPGFRSRHNSSYWRQTPYLGLGPSAHSYDGKRCRTAVTADFRDYIGRLTSCQEESEDRWSGLLYREHLSETELREEFVMTALRTREGISLRRFAARFGDDSCEELIKAGRRWLETGDLELKDEHLSLSEKAILISDAVILGLI